ncbi:MAG TPA: hypothetical protein VHW23_41365 [Kofleriaceae bacterium]|jgi:hypothetical protein|nr:hypothetical protein [Kofleriaceae bacterium]
MDLPATAVEPPLVRIAPGPRIRRHRRVTALSGILLFACMFLPAVDACGPVLPYELPPVLPPYVLGLVFALIAIAQTGRGLRRGIVALRAVSVIAAVAGVVVIPVVPEIGGPELAFGLVLLQVLGLWRTTEGRVAAAAVVAAVVSTLWFGLWCLDDGALIGVYLSLASSLGLLLGAMMWRSELADRPPVDVPPAVARCRERDRE